MMTPEQTIETMNRATKEIQSWDFLDQLAFLQGLGQLAELADGILAKYDGRKQRMEELLDALTSEKE